MKILNLQGRDLNSGISKCKARVLIVSIVTWIPSASVALHRMARSGIRIPLRTDLHDALTSLKLAVCDLLIMLYMCTVFVFLHLKQHCKPYYTPRCFVLIHAHLVNLLNVMACLNHFIPKYSPGGGGVGLKQANISVHLL
jgi:hypothetical protein